jgi:branched-subunit amino acid aminotransferase/4-amino-4-deoxychorismate lyase
LPETCGSLDAATRLLPAGAYTTFRTYQGRGVLRLGDHFARLEQAARLAGTALRLDEGKIRAALKTVLAEAGGSEQRIRLVLDLQERPGSIVFLAEPLGLPAEQDYRAGVAAVTRVMQRDNPRAKLTRFINTAEEIRQAMPVGINEVVMVSPQGELLEGLSSNVFAARAGAIWTAAEGVLEGITRGLVLEIIEESGLTLAPRGYPLAEIDQLEELWLTSASRSVLPVTRLDGLKVGAGMPGEVTRWLMRRFAERIQGEI